VLLAPSYPPRDGLRDVLSGWLPLVKPGGKLVIDIPSEHMLLVGQAFTKLAAQLGRPSQFERHWIESKESLRTLLTEAGWDVLDVVTSPTYRTKLWHLGNLEEMEQAFKKSWGETIIRSTLGDISEEDALAQFRPVWEDLLRPLADANGVVKDEVRVYIGIAQRKVHS